MLNIGEKIYQCRLKKAYTQAWLASQCGIPQPNLSNIEKGKQDLTVSTLVRLAAALGVRPAELMEEEQVAASFPLTRRTIEAIAAAAVNPRVQTSSRLKKIAFLFRQILPETNPKGSSKKITAAWIELKKRFTSQEIRGVCQRIQDALQRKS